METLGILEEIQSLVSDKLQVVSYKWLSRNFLVSSNAAKRLLQEFVETHGSGLEVVYSLAGWLKDNPSSYHIQLVYGPKLEEAKQEFDGNCSVQVYSVQACIPKDPAALWNTEFVQAEELFKQPFTVDNCLRDNRFCGILNSLVKRNVDGIPLSTAAPQTKSVGVPGPSRTSPAHQPLLQPQQNKVKQSNAEVSQPVPNVEKHVKTESAGTGHDQAAKPSADTEKVLPANKKGQNGITSSGNGGSLANLWGRAAAKSKPISEPSDNNNLIANSSATAEAQICAREAIEDVSSDDEPQEVSFKRAFNGERKRRVVLDYSDDEYEDVVNLASPDLPKGPSNKKLPSEKPNLSEQTNGKSKVKEEKPTDRATNQLLSKDSEDKWKVKEEKSTERATNQLLRKDSEDMARVKEEKLPASASNQPLRKGSSGAGKRVNSDSVSEKIHGHNTRDATKENKAATAAPNSPKRRKVLKTCIDERGREVTEVVWEGDETEKKKADCNTTKNAENDTTSAVNNRAPTTKKSPAIGTTAPPNPGGRTGNKKGANKDPKQGNILSFFKRV